MDIALVLDKIRPGAAWRMSNTYENLVATWEDTEQTLPTWEEIETAWAEMQAGPTLGERKAIIRSAINAERDRREQGGFEYAGKRFDSDATSVIRINAAVNTAVAALLAESPFTVDWTAADNTTVPLDAQGLLGLSVALAQHSNTQHVRARALKEQLEEAETAEKLVEVETLLEAWKTEA